MTNRKAILGLLTGASVWGVIWYPFRLLDADGVNGVASTLIVYLVAFALGVLVFGRSLRGARIKWTLVGLGLAAGWTNLAYVLAVIDGQVVRVLLLFYLAPLWTVVFAHYLLGERFTRDTAGVMALAFGGAMVMLWHPDYGMPWPRNGAEWQAISAGAAFAMTNVLSRRDTASSNITKAFAVWLGVLVVAIAIALIRPPNWSAVFSPSLGTWGWLVLIGLLIFIATIVMQYGLTHTPANRAIIILLSELVVVAISSYYLANEVLSLRDWLGGAMILAASFISSRIPPDEGART